MRRSEWLVRAALVFCFLYAGVAVANFGHERFPFFSWNLFSSVPNPHQTDFSARLIDPTAPNGRRYYEHADLQSRREEVQGLVALQQLGKCLEAHDIGCAEVLRKRFESSYLGALPRVRYEVVERSFDIRTRFDCPTCFTREEVLATYTKGGGSDAR